MLNNSIIAGEMTMAENKKYILIFFVFLGVFTVFFAFFDAAKAAPTDLKQLRYQIQEETEETILDNTETAAVKNQPSFSKTSYIIIIEFVVILLLLIFSFFVYRKYKKTKAVKKITPQQ